MVVTASWLGPAAVVRAIQQSLPYRAPICLSSASDQARPPADGTPGGRSGRGAACELLPLVVLRLSRSRCAGARHHPRALGGCVLQPCVFRTSFARGVGGSPAARKPETVVSESLAGMMGAKVGQTLEFFSNGRVLSSAASWAFRRLDAGARRVMAGLVFPCTAFRRTKSSFTRPEPRVKTRARGRAPGNWLAELSQRPGDVTGGNHGGHSIGSATTARWILRGRRPTDSAGGTAV